MKMKKYILVLPAVLLLAVSCSDFLSENPSTSLSEKSVYNSEEALESHIYGILSSFYGRYMMQGYMNEQLHTASGLLMWKGQRTQDDWMEGLKFAKYSTTAPNQGWYAELYAAVNCCNRLLDNLPDSPVDEGFKLQIEGEARFYRAVLYYYLVRLYGDVPLILTCPKSMQETNKPREAWYKVYASIVEDLEFAERHMRDKAEITDPYSGRPCKWAATAMKSSVYMTIGSILSSFEKDSQDQFFDPGKDASLIAAGRDPRTPDFTVMGISSARDAWEKCLRTSEYVISDGPYRLAGDYRQLFRWTEPEDFTLDERIFVLQSTNTSASENRLALMSLPQFVEGSSNTTTKNGNFGRFRPSRFLFQKFAGDNGGEKGVNADTRNIFVSCPDPRFDASFIHTSCGRLNSAASLKIYPYYTCIRIIDGSSCMPYFKKYLDPTFDVNSGCADFYLMRFAEVYLISAEAAARLSVSEGDSWWTLALERIEDLHRRARRSVDGEEEAAWPSWASRTFVDSDELVNAIIWERAYEMCGEGHEWFDTHRCGAKWLSEQIAVPLNEFLQQPEQGPGDDNEGMFKYNYVGTLAPVEPSELRKSLLCAFPVTTEGLYNTAIDPVADQNDFYWQ